ncbi:ArnT family glycosyltransferase [Candidatus Electronema sp. TJ]|uniref:ArnT family glycosyltransferase n=1 Tax=Candidatus Electronema sp. TJ TaxID=3401573 RepID=UPI003AA9570B
MFSSITAFAERWLGTALPQLFLLFLGVLLVILVVTALWDRRINRLGGVFGLLTGLLMAALAVEESLSRFIGGLEPAFRIRLTAALFSLSLLFLTGSAWAKTGLQRRYGLTWTAVSLIVLLTALFPSLLHTFPSLLGVQYGLAVAALFIAFLLLLVFHFSITISELEKQQRALLLRLNRLEGLPAEPEEDEPAKLLAIFWQKWRSICRRPARGTTLGAPLIILAATVSVFLVGMSAPQVMVGDEVTHYYMLETQAKVLPLPNFKVEIPTGWGENELRAYPHSFLWHYLGAILFRLTGGSFAAVQLYQALYLMQFLGIAYLLARSRGGVQTRAAMPYLLILASLPMTLIFTVTFYQDVPMAAQVLTAFYLLRQKRWLLATCFMAFALSIKVTAMLFFPAFFFCLLVWTAQRCSLKKTAVIMSGSVLLIVLCTLGLGEAISSYTSSKFYPAERFQQLVRMVERSIWPEQEKPKRPTLPAVQAAAPQVEKTVPPAGAPKNKAEVITEQKASIIANHPGDLRITANYFVYGGLLLWLLLLTGIAAAGMRLLRHQPLAQEESSCWLWGTGLSYTLIAAAFLATSPDARFFLPGLPFLLLPLAEQTVRLPRPKWLISLLASLAFLQGGYVLAKTYNLRQVSTDLQEAITWLRENPPQPRRVFMYPEGNYRLFPVPHEWYLKYHLRDFWRADNELRAEVLRKFRIGAVVIKKHLVAPVDEHITDLGVYPDYFVKELRQDSRFRKLFENNAIVIFQTPLEVDAKSK